MARLRTLVVTTADGPQDILILDKLSVDEVADNFEPEDLKAVGIPPALAFDLAVELPEAEDEPKTNNNTTLTVPAAFTSTNLMKEAA